MSDKKYKFVYKGADKNIQEYDHNYYNKLIDEHKHKEAYDYAIDFQIEGDPEMQQKWINVLEQNRIEGLRDQKLYEESDELKRPAIDFIQSVYEPEAYDNLIGNKYKDKFDSLKYELGNGCNRLRIEFEDKEQKLFGVDWLDWAKKDNTAQNIDKFYEDNGFSKDYLKNNGIRVFRRGGKDYIEFDKDNPLSNKILMGVFTNHTGAYPCKVYGMERLTESNIDNADYNDIEKIDNEPWFVYDSDNTGFAFYTFGAPPTIYKSTLEEMQDIYTEAYYETTIAYDEISPKVKTSSVKVVPNAFGKLDELNELRNTEGMKLSEYRFQQKLLIDNFLDGIAAMDFTQQDIYTSYFNEDGVAGMYQIDSQEELNKLREIYRSVPNKEIQYGLAMSGGRVGIQIILPSKTEDGTYDVTAPSITFNMFGDNIEQELQTKVNNDPNLKAWRECQLMEEIGYEYVDLKGNIYKPDGIGGWTINNSKTNLNREDIVSAIEEDIYIKEVGKELAFQNMSVNGKIVDNDKFELNKKQAAIQIATNLLGFNIVAELEKMFNTNQLTYNQIWSLKGSGDVVSGEWEDKIPNPDLYNALNLIFETYRGITDRSNLYITK